MTFSFTTTYIHAYIYTCKYPNMHIQHHHIFSYIVVSLLSYIPNNAFQGMYMHQHTHTRTHIHTHFIMYITYLSIYVEAWKLRVEGSGGGEPQSGGQRFCQLKTAKWWHFSFTHHTKLWPNSPPSLVVIYSWQSAYPGEMEPVKDHLSSHGCLTKLRNKPQKKQPGQLSELNC